MFGLVFFLSFLCIILSYLDDRWDVNDLMVFGNSGEGVHVIARGILSSFLRFGRYDERFWVKLLADGLITGLENIRGVWDVVRLNIYLI